MIKVVKRIIKWVHIIIITIVVLLAVGTYLLNTPKVQQWLLHQATEALSDKLETRVEADSISVNLFKLQMSLYGLSVDDRQGRELVGISEFKGNISLKSLAQMKIIINSVETDSLRANLLKERPDSAANYQFIIDALSKDKNQEEDSIKKKESKNKIKIDFRHLRLKTTSIKYHDPSIIASGSLPLLDFKHDGERYDLTIDNLALKTTPTSRKRSSPGTFDISHADLQASIKCTARLQESDSISGTIEKINIRERHSGIDLKDLKLDFSGSNHSAHLKNFRISQGKSKLTLDKADIQLPSSESWKHPSHIKASIRNLNLTDGNGHHLAQLKHLDGSVRINQGLAKKTIDIDNIAIEGVNATISKDSSGKSNYDYIINLSKHFSKPSSAASKVTIAQQHPGKSKSKSSSVSMKPAVSIGRVRLKDIRLSISTPKKSTVINLPRFDADRKNGKYDAVLSGLRLTTDNHKPRKNTGKPRRGWFDAGHLDITAGMRIHASVLNDGTINAHISGGTVKDVITGFDISSLTMDAIYSNESVKISNLSLKQKSTSLHINQADITLPSRKSGRPLSYSASLISGTAILSDISQPFAPVLKDFKMPLNFQTNMSGNAKSMEFTGVSVSTSDQRLTVSAVGKITHLGERHQTIVSFNVNRMHAQESIVEPIIRQFPVKKLMMSELHRLGDIGYSGTFDVFFKRVDFNGNLTTNAGVIGVSLTIDSKEKRLNGQISTKALLVGKVLDMEKLGDVSANATFKIDISKERTAKMRQEKGGKLPIGQVTARVDDCSYGRAHIRGLVIDLESDGAVAHGTVVDEGKRVDLSCEFSFTNTEHLGKNIKISHPKLDIHKKRIDPEAEKAKEERKKEKAEAKAQKQEAKAAAKEQKALEKAEAKEQKAQEKAEAKAKKEEEKQEKAAIKAQKKQEKAEAKTQKALENQNQQEEQLSDEIEDDENKTTKKKRKKVLGIF